MGGEKWKWGDRMCKVEVRGEEKGGFEGGEGVKMEKVELREGRKGSGYLEVSGVEGGYGGCCLWNWEEVGGSL